MSKKGNKFKKQTVTNEEIITEALAEKKEFIFKQEVIAPLILAGLILIFLSPLLFLFEGICADDAAFQSFPKKMAVARAFQQGEIPLWDYHEFCGGKPFYIMMENPINNILL